jgi:hypothetical protein
LENALDIAAQRDTGAAYLLPLSSKILSSAYSCVPVFFRFKAASQLLRFHTKELFTAPRKSCGLLIVERHALARKCKLFHSRVS